MKKIFSLLLLVTFLKGIVFIGLVPLWHFPDEQAHFAQVSYYGEKKELTNPHAKLDVTQEIDISEKIFGTERDYKGNNKFTFHPEFNIDYTDSLAGQFEEELNTLSPTSRQTMVKREATFYPPLYYIFSLIPYNLLYNHNLIERVYGVRLLTIFFMPILVTFAFRTYMLFFDRDEVFALAAATMVAFHPMLSFVQSGVNSDSLFNVLFAAGLYLGLIILMQGVTISRMVLVVAIIYLGIMTKPQGYILLFIFVPPFLKAFFQANKVQKYTIILGVLSSIVFLRKILRQFVSGGQYLPDIPHHSQPAVVQLSLIDYGISVMKHTYKEVVPWYWGVFKWLGVVLPRIVNKVINRVLIIASLGLIIRGLVMIRERKLTVFTISFLFLLYATILYFAAISLFDYLFIRSHGFSIGIQGRYFFPTVTAHMGLLLYGLMAFGLRRKWQVIISKLSGIGMVALNSVALYTIMLSYYDVSSARLFFMQASQYKSGLFKSPFLEVYFFVYLTVLLAFLWFFIRYRKNRITKIIK